MDIGSQSALLAAIIILALAVSALLRPRRRVLALYAFLCLTLAPFYLGEFLSALIPGTFWRRAALVFGSTVPASALAFFMEFLGVAPKNARRAHMAALFGALLGLGVGASPLAHSHVARVVVAIWVFGALLVSFSLLLRRMALTKSRTERARLTYLAVGAGLSIGFTALDTLPSYGIPFPPLGAIVTTLYMFLLAQTLLRLRLLDLHELLGKMAGLSLQALLLLAIFFALVYWARSQLDLFLFNALVASIVVLILVEPLRAKVDQWVVATLFRERFEMIRLLGALKLRLSSVIDVSEMAKLVLDTFHETRRVTHASLYLLSDDRPGFFLLESRGHPPVPFLDAAAARGLVSVALSGQKAVLLENLERRLADLRAADRPDSRRVRDEAKRLGDLKAALKQMNAGIAVPLMGGDRVIGFLNLWDERVPEAYASDEIAAILEVAEQVATVVENSKLYDRIKERDRLAAIGEMSAGLAHEIRNPLGAIKGAAQLLSPAEREGGNAELLEVIVEEVNRLNSVVTQFLDYSHPLKQSFAPTDLAEVVSRTLKLLSPTLPPSIAVNLQVDERLPKVMGDPEQLKQVLINLVQNAVQAMPQGGALTISLSCPDEMPPWRLHDAVERVELRVADSGVGFTEEARRHIFVPFYTTKEKGTGLGLAICQRIVKNHGGTISVNSQAGQGTEFVIRLPAVAGSRPEAPQPPRAAPPEGTPSPDLTPYPGSLAPLEIARPRTRRRERRRRPGG